MNNHKFCQNLPADYQLIDSGDLKKLEKFGEHLIIRPSTLATWKPSQSKAVWDSASANYLHERGWNKKKALDSWEMKLAAERKLKLRLQDNGQIGIFPEHFAYLDQIKQLTTNKKNLKILNLFAYTGMASIYLSNPNLEITHVDIAKKCLDWTKENMQINKDLGPIRLINEDAEEFMKKELRRNNQYQIILIDPPSFSRVTKNKNWDLEAILPELVELLSKLVTPNEFQIFFTSHLQQGSVNTISNLFWDRFKGKIQYHQSELNLTETESGRQLPCSSLSCVGNLANSTARC